MVKELERNYVSIVIPMYNAEETIEACLSALMNQTYPKDKYEIIVVDDGSTDHSSDRINTFDVKMISQANQGPAVARNTGVRYAKGEIIVFTDSDCIASSNFIQEIVKPFADPTVVGVKGVYKTKQRERWARFAQIEFIERYRKLEKIESIDFVDSYAAAFRKEVFEEVGGFDPHFPVANNEDVDLSYKIARLGYHMVFNSRAVVYHTHPGNAIAYLRLKFLRAYWRMLVYRRFPEKILSDTYTPQTLKLQIIFVAAICIFLPISLFYPSIMHIMPYLLGLYLFSTFPFLLEVIRNDRKLWLFSIFALFCRSLVFGFGIVAGLLAQRKRNLLFPMIFGVLDVISVSLAYITAFWLRASVLRPFLPPFYHSLELYLSILPIVVFVFFLSYMVLGLYRYRDFKPIINEFSNVVRAVSLAMLTVITLSFFFKWDYSRGFIILLWITAIIYATAGRAFVRKVQKSLQNRGYQVIRTIIVGSGDTAKLVLRQLQESKNVGIQLAGLVDVKKKQNLEKEWAGIPYLGNIQELEKIIREHSIDEVFIALPQFPHQAILDLVVRCESTKAGFKVVSDLASIVTGRARISPFSGLPIVDLREEGNNLGRRVVKRVFDTVVSALLLLIFVPLFLLFGFLVYSNIPGSVLIKEERVGKGGRLFKMFRFRVHPKGEENNSSVPESIIGRFLRKTYLEELPQLLNVFKGEMSLVGPRPEVPEIVMKYENWQRKRLDVPPGMTGLWQIYGSPDQPLHMDLEYDFFYIKNYNLWMDISILIQTIPVAILGRGVSS